MGVGTQASVGHQHVARSKVWMDLNHLGEIMGAQGSTQHLQDHARARVKQRHQVGHRKPTPGLLAAGLAKVLLQLGGIRHGET